MGSKLVDYLRPIQRMIELNVQMIADRARCCRRATSASTECADSTMNEEGAITIYVP
jgi:hypothetical protein